MSEREAFLRAICAEPDDDLPRLVYADWLDEHGESERAEFIRVQCDPLMWRGCVSGYAEGDLPFCQCDYHVLRRHERELWKSKSLNLWDFVPWVPKDRTMTRHAREMKFRVGYRGGRQDIFWCVPRRGFIDEVACTGNDFIWHADAMLAVTPIKAVTLTVRSGFFYVGDRYVRLRDGMGELGIVEAVRGQMFADEWSAKIHVDLFSARWRGISFIAEWANRDAGDALAYGLMWLAATRFSPAPPTASPGS